VRVYVWCWRFIGVGDPMVVLSQSSHCFWVILEHSDVINSHYISAGCRVFLQYCWKLTVNYLPNSLTNIQNTWPLDRLMWSDNENPSHCVTQESLCSHVSNTRHLTRFASCWTAPVQLFYYQISYFSYPPTFVWLVCSELARPSNYSSPPYFTRRFSRKEILTEV
jgi:hypothetical protein